VQAENSLMTDLGQLRVKDSFGRPLLTYRTPGQDMKEKNLEKLASLSFEYKPFPWWFKRNVRSLIVVSLMYTKI